MNTVTTPAPGAGTRRRARSGAGGPVRDSLLEATRALVAERGPDGATSRLITERAGANLGSITYYFGSKDELVAEALFGELERRLAPVLEQLEADGSGPERLVAAVQLVLIEFQRSRPDVAIYLQALMACGGPGAVATRGRDLVQAVNDRLARVIADLQADGAIAAWVDPPAMANLLIAAANGIALASHMNPEGAKVPALAGQLVGLLLSAGTGGGETTDER